jgi:hypothetical protein
MQCNDNDVKCTMPILIFLFEPLCHLIQSKIIFKRNWQAISHYIAFSVSFSSAKCKKWTCVPGNATVSGLNDMDYPSVNGLVSGMSNVKHVTTTNRVPLPPEVMEHFGRILFWRIVFVATTLSSFNLQLYMGFSSGEWRQQKVMPTLRQRWSPVFCCGGPG